MSEETLQQRFQAGLPETDGLGCPSPEELWSAAAGELPFERIGTLLDHGARCAQCAEALRILQEVRRAAAEVADPPPMTAAPHRRRPRVKPLVPLTLSALAAVGIWVTLRPPPPEQVVVERGTAGGPSLRAISAELQPAQNAVLRWSEVPGATSYNVTVLTPDLTVVHHAVGLSSREVRLPDAVSRPAQGKELLWNVDAVLPDGRTVASPTFQLRLH
jgi:hypothetical protein